MLLAPPPAADAQTAKGMITGHVYNAATGKPIYRYCVEALIADLGLIFGQGFTGLRGNYVIGNLPPAPDYEVLFTNSDFCVPPQIPIFWPQWWEGKQSESQATTFAVRGGVVVSGIDASLKKMPLAVSGAKPAFGPTAGGNVVALTGSGFYDGQLPDPPVTNITVHFGSGRSPNATCSTETSCTAVAPPHAPGTVRISFTQGSITVGGPKYAYR